MDMRTLWGAGAVVAVVAVAWANLHNQGNNNEETLATHQRILESYGVAIQSTDSAVQRMTGELETVLRLHGERVPLAVGKSLRARLLVSCRPDYLGLLHLRRW